MIRRHLYLASLSASLTAILLGCAGNSPPAGRTTGMESKPSDQPAKNAEKLGIDLEMIRRLMGKGPKSPENDQFLKAMGEKAEVDTFDSGAIVFYSWKSKGLSLGFYGGKLTIAFLYSEGAEEYKQYPGELPRKLSFADTRADVEAKLGQPDTKSDGTIDWADYKSEGLHITYDSEDTKDPKARIFTIGLVPVDDSEK